MQYRRGPIPLGKIFKRDSIHAYFSSTPSHGGSNEKEKNKGGGKRGKRKRKGKEEGKEEVKGEKEESFYSKPAPSLRFFF